MSDACDDATADAAFQQRLRTFHLTDEEWLRWEPVFREADDVIGRACGFAPGGNPDRDLRARLMVNFYGRLLATIICKATIDDSELFAMAVNGHFAIALDRYGGPPLRLRLDSGLADTVARFRTERAAWEAAEPPARPS